MEPLSAQRRGSWKRLETLGSIPTLANFHKSQLEIMISWMPTSKKLTRLLKNLTPNPTCPIFGGKPDEFRRCQKTFRFGFFLRKRFRTRGFPQNPHQANQRLQLRDAVRISKKACCFFRPYNSGTILLSFWTWRMTVFVFKGTKQPILETSHVKNSLREVFLQQKSLKSPMILRYVTVDQGPWVQRSFKVRFLRQKKDYEEYLFAGTKWLVLRC